MTSRALTPPPHAADLDGYDPEADFAGSLLVAFEAIRARIAAGGPPWTPKPRIDQQERKDTSK